MGESTSKKRQLFEKFREGVVKQLASIQAKDPEMFLESVQLCEELRLKIDVLSNQQISQLEEEKIKKIILEIIQIRKQISVLIPELQEYLLNQIKGVQQKNKIQRGYGELNVKPPSIFFDKRK